MGGAGPAKKELRNPSSALRPVYLQLPQTNSGDLALATQDALGCARLPEHLLWATSTSVTATQVAPTSFHPSQHQIPLRGKSHRQHLSSLPDIGLSQASPYPCCSCHTGSQCLPAKDICTPA